MRSKEKIIYKQELTISKIGVFRFWLGIVYGFLYAALFFCFVFLFTEAVDLFMVLWGYDVPKVSEASLFYQKLFLITLSIAFGNSAMIRCWFSIPSKYFNGKNHFSSIKITKHSLFIEYMVWYATMVYITRFLFQFPEIDLSIFETFGYLFICIPIYLFFVSWTEIIRTIKAQSWMWKAFVISYILAALISFVDVSQYKIAEIAFEKVHNEEIVYVAQEVEYAKRAYSIEFSAETILSLKELRTERALDLLEKTRGAFYTNDNISLDTIIMEKILIHNFKGFYKNKRESYAYITPFQAYLHLRKVAPKSHEAIELLNILEEFHQLSIIVYMRDNYLDKYNLTLDSRKTNILLYNFHSPGTDEPFTRMANQTFFLVYTLKKLGMYEHHPLFNSTISLPQPAPLNIFDRLWAKEHFPELQN
ncbi:hypothetical protein [Kordia zhangzhouensis]|uniref:hypothetical protein n=1 Tax=Kordia zhangzhouensis TaxID=1620405 RepID=UPI0006298EC3|nr:hypothetical protein [Kordia zhangzhouensis]